MLLIVKLFNFVPSNFIKNKRSLIQKYFSMKANEKISKLRNLMKSKSIDAYIIPSSDPHLSEYLPEHWQSRAWLSEFSGSAGTVVVTKTKAGLWTDSRYFLQAEQELKGSGIDLCKMGLPETPSIEEWIIANLKPEQTVGFDGRLLTHAAAKRTINQLQSAGISVQTDVDLVSEIWEKRPKLPTGKAFEHELRYSGKTTAEKIEQIRENLAKQGATACIISALDEVAWTFNIRGNDVAYNPVVLSYGFISADEAILFIDPAKIDENLAQQLEEQGVNLFIYDEIDEFIKKIPKDSIVAVDENRINHRLASLIPKKVKQVSTISIPTMLKTKKNEVELENIRNAMTNDGVAMVEFLYWLEKNVGKEKISELTIADKLLEFRSKQPGFVSESFNTIAGYRDHGAIVHYSASKESAYEIKPEGFLLVDSGGQFKQGTTDITRTIHLSKPSEEESIDFTLVLKGMIQLSKVKFPMGTRGTQLDVLARAAMWGHGINYGHGTGHGVGAFLNVHEGPQAIRPNEVPIVLELGMVQSNEPGIYRAGKYGIRIENLIACVPFTESEFGSFIQFETLTICPIDTKPIKVDMLTAAERSWLNSYHEMVYNRLESKLSNELKVWLKEKTKKI